MDTVSTPRTAPSSPFFAPSTPNVTVTEQTPGGTKRKIKKQKPEVAEHKTGLFGCSANLVNAIVGSGIVGIPYAIKQSGFLAGVLLVLICAVLTDKSLRLLVATAKHVCCPSYETSAEAAYGPVGFRFVALNMLILSYGAMLSYLMIVKDSFSSLFGVDPDNKPMRRAILLLVSLTVMLPLASKRDMADLAFTSRLSVLIDTFLVFLVAHEAPVALSFESIGGWEGLLHRTVHFDTIFVGLGVLSFAFVCQHSAFIIAGSMEKPTNDRWAIVTRNAVSMSCTLALICGVSGYLGFLENTSGNVLGNLDDGNWKSAAARTMLGITMLFVYPVESFVARHVCVVLFFAGRRAHEGDDSTILNRRDRRVGLTTVLYTLAVIPAAAFDDLGPVLAITGAVGGSCLSYIGPGLIYLGIHGERFLELVDQSWFGTLTRTRQVGDKTAKRPMGDPATATAGERIPLVNPLFHKQPTLNVPSKDEAAVDATTETGLDPFHVAAMKWLLWFTLGMPIWCFLAKAGKKGLEKYDREMAMKSPHPIRIGDVKRTRSADVERQQDQKMTIDSSNAAFMIAPGEQLVRHNSFTSHFGGGGREATATAISGGGGGLPPPLRNNPSDGNNTPKILSINEMLGKELVQKRKLEQVKVALAALENDQQAAPAGWSDFLIAILYILFGLLALVAGVLSLVQQQ
ncbi:hypothetical protein ACA910_022486 [Epithemia clementina (nom. ined.)]